MEAVIFIACSIAIGVFGYTVGFIEGQKQKQPKRDKRGRYIKED